MNAHDNYTTAQDPRLEGIDEVLTESFPELDMFYVVGLEERTYAERDLYEVPDNVRSPDFSEMEPELCGDHLSLGFGHVHNGREGFYIHDEDGISCFWHGPPLD